ncbi:MAG: hypothetical protein RL329_2617 [Bacteroidota bacterium]|jgi:hypothetical protein
MQLCHFFFDKSLHAALLKIEFPDYEAFFYFPVKSLNVDWTVQKIFSNQFAKFFNGYVQAINNQENRTGTLLEEPFRRIPVETDSHLLHLVYYIHFNPQKHRFIIHFKNYPHSSYHAFLSNQPTRLARDEVLTHVTQVVLNRKRFSW